MMNDRVNDDAKTTPARVGCVTRTDSPHAIPVEDWRDGGKSPVQAAAFTGESVRSIYAAMAAGELRWTRFQSGRRIPVVDLMKRLAARAKNERPPGPFRGVAGEGPGDEAA